MVSIDNNASIAQKTLPPSVPLGIRPPHFIDQTSRQDGAPQSLPDAPGLERNPALALYSEHYSKARNSTIFIANDIAQAGLLQASSIVRALQFKLREKPEGSEVNIVFATGNTQWIGLTSFSSILTNWGNWDATTREALTQCEVDLEQKPSLERVFATHLDTIFPQLRTDYCAYANQLNHIFDKLDIPSERRSFLFGDVVQDATLECGYRKANDTEWQSIIASVDVEGLQLEAFNKGELLPAHPQYALLLGMKIQAEAFAKTLKEAGGPDIALFSVGGCYEGKGHIAFNECGTPFEQGIDIIPLSYHAAAGNIKDNGGMHNFYSESGLPKYAAITLGPADLTSNESVSFISVITGKEKRETVNSLVERPPDPERPASLLQRGAATSAIILEPASSSSLRIQTHPWDFRPFTSKDWTPALKAKLFINLSLETGLPVHELTVSDFSNSSGAEFSAILAQRNRNLITLLDNNVSWEKLKSDVVNSINSSLVTPELVSKKLGLEPGDTILHIGPHLDDLSLAAQFLVDQWCRPGGQRLVSHYTASGYTAVATPYVLELLKVAKSFDASLLSALLACAQKEEVFLYTEEAFLNDLIDELATAPINSDPSNYRTWELLTPKEKELRAMLLILRMEHASSLKGAITSPTQVSALYQVISKYEQMKARWGASEPKVIQEMKVAVRFAEEQTELMARGVKHRDVHYPLDTSWYGLERQGTAKSSDIETVKKIILQNSPRVVFVNGEGFMDHGAHAITQNTVEVATMELLQEGLLPKPFTLLYYRGVWDRTEISGAPGQLVVELDNATLLENRSSFLRNYRTQAPGLVPDGGLAQPAFFSDQVLNNSFYTKSEFLTLTGQASQAAGLLAFNYFSDLHSRNGGGRFVAAVSAKRNELERVQSPINAATMRKIIGHEAPYVNLKEGKAASIARILRENGIDENIFMFGRSA